MKINKIEINNYKSIKEKQTFDFRDSMITLLGKNGSGKTNIMDCLFTIFDKFANKEREGLVYKFYINLDKDDLVNFKDTLNSQEDITEIEAYFIGNDKSLTANINRIKSRNLVDLLSITKESIYDISKSILKYLMKFSNMINNFSSDEPQCKQFTIDLDFKGVDIEKSTNYGFYINKLIDELNRLINEVKIIIKERIDGEELSLSTSYLSRIDLLGKKQIFKLVYKKPMLTNFESKYIQIDEKAIKKEIHKINLSTEDLRKKINVLYEKLNDRISAFSDLLEDYNRYSHKQDEKYESLMKKIINISNPKVYYLKNDNNQLFFKEKNIYGTYNQTMSERVILDTFMKYKYPVNLFEKNKGNGKDLLSAEEKKLIALDLDAFINKDLPNFEKDMINKIKVNEDLSFSIVEMSGVEIPFNSTNSGRRWYYTYFFIKQCLQPGDILMMDEPANFLHPQAQVEIRKDLENLSKHNKIIISTHSPYMISSKSFVYYVDISDKGTYLTEQANKEYQNIFGKLGIFGDDTVFGDLLLKNEMLTLNEIGERLKNTFKKLKIMQKDIALKMGIDDTYLRKKFRGKNLTFDDIGWFIEAYQLNPLEILLRNRVG